MLGELRVIRGAPVSFFSALLVVGGANWWAMDWRYGGIVANRDAELASAKAVRDEYKEKLQGATPDQAKARIDTLEARIKRLEPRTLTTEQRDQLAKFVSIPAGSTYILSVMTNIDCRDCNEYGTVFQSVLSDARGSTACKDHGECGRVTEGRSNCHARSFCTPAGGDSPTTGSAQQTSQLT